MLQRGMALDPEDRPGPPASSRASLPTRSRTRGKTRETERRGAPAAASNAAVRDGRAWWQSSQPGAIVLAAIFIVLAVATIAGAVLSGEMTRDIAAERRQHAGRAEAGREEEEGAEGQKEPKEEPAAAAPAPTDDQGSFDEARGAELNQQGFVLMGDGRYDEAIPVFQQAVGSFPPDTGNLNYAYALFNLGKSLRLAGRPEEAIPVLERRLEIPNQTDAVQAELTGPSGKPEGLGRGSADASRSTMAGRSPNGIASRVVAPARS